MDDKKSLLMRIMTCDFILTETALFLDSHPNCADALAFYQKHLAMRNTACLPMQTIPVRQTGSGPRVRGRGNIRRAERYVDL